MSSHIWTVDGMVLVLALVFTYTVYVPAKSKHLNGVKLGVGAAAQNNQLAHPNSAEFNHEHLCGSKNMTRR